MAKQSKSENKKDIGSSDGVEYKPGEWKHPDFPHLTRQQLLDGAAKFDIDSYLIALCFDEPFYADIIRSLHKTAKESVGTAGVLYKDDTMHLWYNPLFMGAYSHKKVLGILKHEALHLALEHTTTRRYQPHLIWNWATDLAIDSCIKIEELPDFCLRPGRRPPTPPNLHLLPKERQASWKRIQDLIESFPLDLAAEEYFSKLMDDEDVKEMLQQSGGGGSGESEEGFEGDNHEGWDELSNEEREYVAGKIRQIVKDASEKADAKNQWGTVSSKMREEIRKKVKGEIDWRTVLHNFVGSSNRADRTTSVFRLNRKYPGIHAGHTRDYKPTINCYIDQSGSMSDEDILLCFSELASLSLRVDIKVYHFDTEVDEDSLTVWKKGCAIPKTLRTRCGGTDFEAPTAHSEKTKPDGYIILTDGGAPKPKSSVRRRCWVLVPGQSLMWGEADSKDVTVRMKKPFRGDQ
jgi:predicted metal-dependent peptidase